ncbi:MAG: hypothetical protein HY401_09950 [Elusimicrobia bacterium]|nr:hypothetical protein [Elusimicrobiota bacterium]
MKKWLKLGRAQTMLPLILLLACPLGAEKKPSTALSQWKNLAGQFERAPRSEPALRSSYDFGQEAVVKPEPANVKPDTSKKSEPEECDYTTYLEYRDWLTKREPGAPACGTCREYLLWKKGREEGLKKAEETTKKEDRKKKWANMLEGAFLGGILSAVTRSVSDQVKGFLDKNLWLLAILAAVLVVGLVVLLTNVFKKDKPSDKPKK